MAGKDALVLLAEEPTAAKVVARAAAETAASAADVVAHAATETAAAPASAAAAPPGAQGGCCPGDSAPAAVNVGEEPPQPSAAAAATEEASELQHGIARDASPIKSGAQETRQQAASGTAAATKAQQLQQRALHHFFPSCPPPPSPKKATRRNNRQQQQQQQQNSEESAPRAESEAVETTPSRSKRRSRVLLSAAAAAATEVAAGAAAAAQSSSVGAAFASDAITESTGGRVKRSRRLTQNKDDAAAEVAVAAAAAPEEGEKMKKQKRLPSVEDTAAVDAIDVDDEDQQGKPQQQQQPQDQPQPQEQQQSQGHQHQQQSQQKRGATRDQAARIAKGLKGPWSEIFGAPRKAAATAAAARASPRERKAKPQKCPSRSPVSNSSSSSSSNETAALDAPCRTERDIEAVHQQQANLMKQQRQQRQQQLQHQELQERLRALQEQLAVAAVCRQWLDSLSAPLQSQSAAAAPHENLKELLDVPSNDHRFGWAASRSTPTVFLSGPFVFTSEVALRAAIEAAGVLTTRCRRRARCTVTGCLPPSDFTVAAAAGIADGEAVIGESQVLEALGVSVETASERFSPLHPRSCQPLAGAVRQTLSCVLKRRQRLLQAQHQLQLQHQLQQQQQQQQQHEEGSNHEELMYRQEFNQKEERLQVKLPECRVQADEQQHACPIGIQAQQQRQKQQQQDDFTQSLQQSDHCQAQEGGQDQKQQQQQLGEEAALDLSYLREIWPVAFNPVSPAEIGGHDDAAVSLHALLSAAARSCAAAAAAAAGGRQGAAPAVAAPPTAICVDITGRDRKKRRSCAVSLGGDEGPQPAPPTPGVVVVLMPPRTGGKALVRLTALASRFAAAEEETLREASHIEGLMYSFLCHAAETKEISNPSLAAAAGKREAADGAPAEAPPQPLIRLSIYDLWSLSKKQLQRLLLRRREGALRVMQFQEGDGSASAAARLAAANAASAAAAPDVCLAVWREGDDAASARAAAEGLIEDAIRDPALKGASRSSAAASRPQQQRSRAADIPEDEAGNSYRNTVAYVELSRPPREVFIQRLLAIVRGALAVRVDRRFVGLVLDATGPLNEEECPSLGAALNCLHIVLRTHPHLRYLHAAAAAPPEAAPALSSEGLNADTVCTAATADAATLLPYEEPPWDESVSERELRWQKQELLLRHFVIPPLEKPLELPWDLAEAPLMPAWRLQRGGKQQQLLLFSLLNAQVGDILVAPLHALDLLFCKMMASRDARGALAGTTSEQAEMLREQSICNIDLILRAYLSAAKMLKWEETTRGPLADVNDEALCVLELEKADKTFSGGSYSHCTDVETLCAAVSKTSPLCLAPLASPAAALACELVGELTLGSVAMLQHGDLPGALECPESGSAAAMLQCRRMRSLALQQRQMTRRRMQKAAEGPQRAVLLAQRLTALALSNFAHSCSTRLPSAVAASSGKRADFVEIVDADDAGSESSMDTPNGVDVEESSCEEAAVPPAAGSTGVELDVMEALNGYGTLGVLSFASVSTILHGGDELRQSLLERAAEMQKKTIGKGKVTRGGRNKGIALDPQVVSSLDDKRVLVTAVGGVQILCCPLHTLQFWSLSCGLWELGLLYMR